MIDIVEASLDVTLNSPHGLVGRFTSSIYDIDDTEIGQQIQYKQDRMEQRMDREEICEMCTEYMPDTQCEYETECKMMETLRKIKDLKEQNMVLQEENNRIKAEITGR